MKPWYESKIIGLGLLALCGALSDGLTNNWSWRQFSVAGRGVLVIVVRAFYTDTEITSGVKKGAG